MLTSAAVLGFLAANMFVIPLGMLLGADITASDFIVKNLIPATIGNLIGGGFFVATWFGMSYGSWEKVIMAHVNSTWARFAPKALVPHHVGDAGSNGSSGHGDLHSKEMSAMVAELPVAATVHPSV